MKWIWLTVLSILAASGPSLRQGALPQIVRPAVSTASVAGVVVDAGTGMPVAGADVSVNLVRPPLQRLIPKPIHTLTDAEGRFEFTGLPAGMVILLAAARDYLLTDYHPEVPPMIADGEHRADFVIRIRKAATIAGTFRDERGIGLPRLEVSAFRRTSRSGSTRAILSPQASAVSDARGRFTLEGLIPADYVIAARTHATTISQAVMSVVRAAGPTGQSSSAPAGALRRMSESEAPLVTGTGLGLKIGSDTVSITSGTSALPVPTPAGSVGCSSSYRTTYYPNATILNDARVVTAGSGAHLTGIDLALRPSRTFTVSGMLETSEGVGAFLGVRLVPDPDDAAALNLDRDGEVAASTVNADGHYTIRCVPIGRYRLKSYLVTEQAAGPNAASARSITSYAQAAVAVDAADLVVPTLRLRAPYDVTGTVLLAETGRPPLLSQLALGVVLDPLSSQPMAQLSYVPIDSEGRFHFAGVLPGRYRLMSNASYFRPRNGIGGWKDQSMTLNGQDLGELIDVIDTDVKGILIKVMRVQTGPASRLQ